MKNLQLKLDIIGSAISCVGILLAAYAFYTATFWVMFVGALLTVIGFIIFAGSTRIARIFVKE